MQENTFFHNQTMVLAREGYQMVNQEKFIFSILVSKVRFNLADLEHAIILTKKLWRYMTEHWTYFLDVINKPDIFFDPKRTRQQLSPFLIKHTNLKRRTLKYKLITNKEHAEDLKKLRKPTSATKNFSEAQTPALDHVDSATFKNKKSSPSNARLRQERSGRQLTQFPDPAEETKDEDAVNEMISDPLAAQLTLQFAVNMF